ncbi:3-phosphoshikimate 1-carboxyvinyltransferase [Anaerosolibacter carboniphilus]|uniref:3-phosphoshikimate 1-carboxyvinyltransferase n=1 Tax=Anaerosolibacter carboniphilus TaxID=1417629 RepID=A0A841L0H6_9FIRM|nr:3-phosphoshikimate 1-carboxyvinyltransferase [Anaerosolibacter carboniphilus]MBB6218078.1 3-phosphoshikimate 1-carboxyvinyltransferase [Anaerosolibacter carboniphilus]
MFIKPLHRVKEVIDIPGDKSISHRGIIFSAIAQGESQLYNFLTGEDCLRTIDCFQKLGVSIKMEKDFVKIRGVGLRGLKVPEERLDVGNSGTTIRLMSGLLSGQNFDCEITGDASIQRRPMDRIILPLKQMGASIEGIEAENLAPLRIKGKMLQGISYDSPIASAQVKSAILLAGLYAQGETRIREPYLSRNHTEIMLKDMGADIREEGLQVICRPGNVLYGKERRVPGDISSAAFFLVLGAILGDSDILLRNVGINPTRTGSLDVLMEMGGQIRILNVREECGERIGDIRVKGSTLKGIEIGGALIPRLIDEIPVLAVAAAFAEGTTVIKDAQELKVKESNRIDALVTELKKIGVDIEQKEDGMVIRGGKGIKGGKINSYGDHRIAMAMTIAGLGSEEGVEVDTLECAAVSFPYFYDIIERMMNHEQ